jgi:hypothetical protein
MPEGNRAEATAENRGGEASKRQLQLQMEQTRESLAETASEIKETIEQEVESVKKTVSGVLNYREQFQKEPLVWSLGALSAGFALGYTVGYAHKNTKGGKQTPVMAFADSMVDELSNMGHGLVMPALDGKLKELFGFELSDLFDQIRDTKKPSKKRSQTKRITSRAVSQKRAVKKKPRSAR